MNAITEIDANAPVVVRRSIHVGAPLQRVWRLLADVPSWPRWQPEITAARAAGPLAVGDTFRWSTAGLDIESTVYAVEAPRRILWGGSAHGIVGVHLWTFEEAGSSVRVRTEESWDGEPVRADVAGMRAALDDSLASWLGHLKSAAEHA
ncbi:Shy6-polyketide cyclase [Streptomonospora alba]|uniref:Shy6-polyketide cyclase n=1 Tax=Streptomonospora alba TaxID=183763 RepID=A0A0C2JMF5_9ACTN|nr:SRPBCC family protein [Streptomonospora alba]KIH98052.1 Shy6-polyketide cyclase [Streptomonospora alba]